MTTQRHWYPLAALSLLLACSSSEQMDRRLSVGQEPGPMDGGSAGQGGGAGQGGSGGITSSAQELGLHVEDIDEMTIEVITLMCAGDCAEVEAVAHGGNPPYTFSWEDGSTDAKRHVCLDASATLSVS